MYAVNLFSAKVPRQFDGENNSILTNDARKIGYSHGTKNTHLDPYLVYHIKNYDSSEGSKISM